MSSYLVSYIVYSHKITNSESIFGQNNQTMSLHGDDYLWSVGIYNWHIFFITMSLISYLTKYTIFYCILPNFFSLWREYTSVAVQLF